MPSLDLSQNILSAGADVSYGDAASARASTSVDLNATADLRRGLRIELGAQGLATLQAAWEKFVTAGVQVDGAASAEVEVRAQMPLDLFAESGAIVDLRAAAQAGIRARVALGLSLGDFLELAMQDSRMEGVWTDLLRVFLEEVQIVGGVRASVSFAAMVYGTMGITGRLVAGETGDPGFTVSADMGYGIEGGAGVQVFGEFGLKDPRRWLSRSVDLLVDDVTGRIAAVVEDPQTEAMVRALRTPARIALRSAFEMGLELAESGDSAFAPNEGAASRAVTVALEESQRFLLEELVSTGIALLERLAAEVGEPGSDTAADTLAGREELLALLTSRPEDPFEFRKETALYWAGLVNVAATLALNAGGGAVPPAWRLPIALVWSASQLLFVGVRRVISAEAHVSFFEAMDFTATTERKTPFQGSLPSAAELEEQIEIPTPPTFVTALINETIGKPASHDPAQQDLVEFLLQSGFDVLLDEVPASRPILEIFAGPDGDAEALAAAASLILTNVGAFRPKNGQFDVNESLGVIADGLTAYLDVRVANELRPALAAALQDDHPELWMMLDEVLLASTSFMVRVAMQEAIEWSVGGRAELREACSAILMKLATRTLVVSQDILTDQVLRSISGTFETMASDLAKPGSLQALFTLPGLPPPVDMPDDSIIEAVAKAANLPAEPMEEILRATLEVAAEITAPLPAAARQRIRQSLYALLDPYEAGDLDFLEKLAASPAPPGDKAKQALITLGTEVGSILGERLLHFFMLFLGKAAEIIQAELAAFFGEVEKVLTEEYLPALDEAFEALAADLARLPAEIAKAATAVTQASVQAIEQVETLLGFLGSPGGRAELLEVIAERWVSLTVPEFAIQVSGMTREELVTSVANRLGRLGVDELIAALDPLGDDLEAVLEQIRGVLESAADAAGNIDLDGEIVAQIKDIVIDACLARLDDAPLLDLPNLTISTPIGVPIPLGAFTFGKANLKAIIEAVAGPLEWLEAFVEGPLREALENLFQAEDALAAHQASLASVQALEAETARQREESFAAAIDLELLSPLSLSTHGPSVEVEILAKGLPTSFLGIGQPEARRVFVLLNERSVPIERFAVERVAGAGNPGGREIASESRGSVTTTPHWSQVDRPIGTAAPRAARGVTAVSGVSARRELLRSRGERASPWGLRIEDVRPLTPGPTSSSDRFEVLSNAPQGVAVARGQLSARRVSQLRGRMHEIGSVRQHSFEPSGNRRRSKPDREDLAQVSLGRAHVLTAWDRNLLLDSVEPGLLLSTTIDSREMGIRDGLNTLTVFVTNGRGLTLKQTVPFVFESGPVSASVDIPRPERTEFWQYEELPELLRDLIGGPPLPDRIDPTAQVDSPAAEEPDPGPSMWIAPVAARARARTASLEQEERELSRSTRLLDVMAKAARRGGLRVKRAAQRTLRLPEPDGRRTISPQGSTRVPGRRGSVSVGGRE